MGYFTSYKNNIVERIKKRLDVEYPLLIYLPYSIDQFTFFNNLKFKVVDLRKFLFRYSTNVVDYLIRRIGKLAEERTLSLAGLDFLYRFYPRNKDIIFEIMNQLTDKKIIVTLNDLEIINMLSKYMKMSFIQLEEASLYTLWDYIDRDINLNTCEGSSTAYNMLIDKDYFLSENIFYKYLYKDSNLRLLLYYFTFYRGIGGIARILGSQVGTYVNRLMKRGIIMRVGKKRAVYLIRDPLIRVIFTRIYNRGKDWYYAGFHYLIRKLFEGIKNLHSVVTLDGELYIGEPVKFQLIDYFSFRFRDKDGVKYFIGIGYNIRRVKEYSRRYTRDKKIIILKDIPDIRVRRSLRKEGFSILTIQNLEYIAREIGFPRGI